MPRPKFPTEAELRYIPNSSSSKGNQVKYRSLDGAWYYKSNFYYQGKFWRDDLVECIASKLAKEGFKMPFCTVLPQYSVARFGQNGTMSKNFLKSNEEFISFERILQANGLTIPLDQGLVTFNAVLRVYKQCCGLDATDYLLTMCLLDYLVGNEDRHTHNFGVIKTSNGFRLCPIFDFGLGMFEHDLLYEDYKFRDKLSLMQFKTFGPRLEILLPTLMKEYPQLKKVLQNKVVTPSRFVFPSVDAETYLRNACLRLGVGICND